MLFWEYTPDIINMFISLWCIIVMMGVHIISMFTLLWEIYKDANLRYLDRYSPPSLDNCTIFNCNKRSMRPFQKIDNLICNWFFHVGIILSSSLSNFIVQYFFSSSVRGYQNRIWWNAQVNCTITIPCSMTLLEESSWRCLHTSYCCRVAAIWSLEVSYLCKFWAWADKPRSPY